jgi:hypothetical protein
MGGVDSWFDDLDEKKVTSDCNGRSHTLARSDAGNRDSKYPYS